MDTLIDLLIYGETISRTKEDGTIERCEPDDLEGKDFEIISTRDVSFAELKNEYEPFMEKTNH